MQAKFAHVHALGGEGCEGGAREREKEKGRAKRKIEMQETLQWWESIAETKLKSKQGILAVEGEGECICSVFW